jgi:hypothetical protein
MGKNSGKTPDHTLLHCDIVKRVVKYDFSDVWSRLCYAQASGGAHGILKMKVFFRMILIFFECFHLFNVVHLER